MKQIKRIFLIMLIFLMAAMFAACVGAPEENGEDGGDNNNGEQNGDNGNGEGNGENQGGNGLSFDGIYEIDTITVYISLFGMEMPMTFTLDMLDEYLEQPALEYLSVVKIAVVDDILLFAITTDQSQGSIALQFTLDETGNMTFVDFTLTGDFENNDVPLELVSVNERIWVMLAESGLKVSIDISEVEIPWDQIPDIPDIFGDLPIDINTINFNKIEIALVAQDT